MLATILPVLPGSLFLKRYDGWFLVLVSVLMTLAFVLATAMSIWCVTNGHGEFTGSWSWSDLVTVNFECSF